MTQRDPTDWMWAEAVKMLERAERLERRFFGLGRSAGRRAAWQPPVDVFETEQDVWVLIALPGVSPDHTEAYIQSGTLIVTGSRPLPATLRRAQVHRLEIPHGHFERRIELPPGRYEVGEREWIHGCLVLNLRKLI